MTRGDIVALGRAPDLIVSHHHEWRGPATAPDTCICMDCGQLWRVGREATATLPRCKPKIELASSGFGGKPLAEYLVWMQIDPLNHPRPGMMITAAGKAVRK